MMSRPAASDEWSNPETLTEFRIEHSGMAVTQHETNNTLEAIEENQARLRASIDESRRLTERAQMLLDKHRNEIEKDE